MFQALCHCQTCRKVSGGTNTVNFAIPDPNFTLTQGNPKTFETEHETGMKITLFFCPECGTALWKEADSDAFKGLKLVQAGTVSDVSQLQKGMDTELWVTYRVPWLAAIDGVEQKSQF